MSSRLQSRISKVRKNPKFYCEKLRLEAQELILGLMKDAEVTQTELAKRLGKSKPYISTLLQEDRNLTLNSLAAIGFELGVQINLQYHPLEAIRTQTRYVIVMKHHEQTQEKRFIPDTFSVPENLDLSAFNKDRELFKPTLGGLAS